MVIHLFIDDLNIEINKSKSNLGTVGKGFVSLSHARALVVACMHTMTLAPASPTQVVSEGERNPKMVGPCIDGER